MSTTVFGNENENSVDEASNVQPLDEMFSELEYRSQEIEKAQNRYEESLQRLASAHGKTFCYNEQWYQICERKGKVFMKQLPAAPKTYIKGRPKKNVQPSAEQDATSLDEVREGLNQPEVTEDSETSVDHDEGTAEVLG